MMDNLIKKQVGKEKTQSPLEKLMRINSSMRKLGCIFRSKEPSSLFRKIVGRPKHGF
jgi:hypothetical protein